MSILLDALKRSEEQRRLGRPPDIHSPVGQPSDHEARRRKWLRLVVLGLCAVAAAWFGWRLYQQGAVTTAPANTAGQVSIPTDENETAGTSATDQGGRSRVDSGPRTPVESFAAEGKTAARAAEPAEESVSPARAKADLNRSFTEFEAAAVPESAPQQGQPAVKPSPSAAPQAAAKSSRQSQQRSAATEPISYWELPQGIRDSLPDLRITVLVYAEQPADRFVLMGGQRRVEKDQIQQGLVLEEIRREGAVFVYRNYRFLVEG